MLLVLSVGVSENGRGYHVDDRSDFHGYWHGTEGLALVRMGSFVAPFCGSGSCTEFLSQYLV